MHSEVMISPRALNVVFYFFCMLPLFLVIEWGQVYYWNEFSGVLNKFKEYRNLLNKTGNAAFVLRKHDELGDLLLKNDQANKFLQQVDQE